MSPQCMKSNDDGIIEALSSDPDRAFQSATRTNGVGTRQAGGEAPRSGFRRKPGTPAREIRGAGHRPKPGLGDHRNGRHTGRRTSRPARSAPRPDSRNGRRGAFRRGAARKRGRSRGRRPLAASIQSYASESKEAGRKRVASCGRPAARKRKPGGPPKGQRCLELQGVENGAIGVGLEVGKASAAAADGMVRGLRAQLRGAIARLGPRRIDPVQDGGDDAHRIAAEPAAPEKASRHGQDMAGSGQWRRADPQGRSASRRDCSQRMTGRQSASGRKSITRCTCARQPRKG